MIGKPKYKAGDKVKFKFERNHEVWLEGVVEIVDAYGTLEQNEEVSYDILVENSPHFKGEPCLYKHIRESNVTDPNCH